jgi:hypothetical protein
MTSYDKKLTSVIQKEWYYINHGSAHSFLFTRDFPFEIDPKFKLRSSLYSS